MKDLFFEGFADSLCPLDGDDLSTAVDMRLGDPLFSLEGEELNVSSSVGLPIPAKAIISLYFSSFAVCLLLLFSVAFFSVMYKININHNMIIL